MFSRSTYSAISRADSGPTHLNIERLSNDSVLNKEKVSRRGRLTRCRLCFHQQEKSRRILIQKLCSVRLKVRVTATAVFQRWLFFYSHTRSLNFPGDESGNFCYFRSILSGAAF